MWGSIQRFPCFRILLGGDFNLHLELRNNASIQKVGHDIFSAFVEETDLTDCWKVLHPTDNRFTFYRKLHGEFLGSRIDYFFASPLLLNYLHDTTIGLRFQSDHCPVEVTFLLNRNPQGPAAFRFPDSMLGNDAFCLELTTMIEEITKICSDDSPVILWDRIKLAIKSRMLEHLSSSKARLREFKALSQEIQSLQATIDEWILLQGPLDELMLEVEEKGQQLQELASLIDRPQRRRNLTRSEVYKETCSQYFFRKVQGVSGAIKQLFDASDNLLTSDQEILTVCSWFYSTLFEQGNPQSCRMSNYTTPPPERVLSDEQRSFLREPIEVEDLEYALKYMKKEKSPGIDGLTVGFYKRFWPIVSTLVLDSILHAQDTGSFTQFQRLGILKLLPKPHRDPRRVKNLQPITLLNVDYKLFTKVLANRIKVVLPSIIHTDQNGFMKNRFMGNNVLDVYALVALAEETRNENMVVLALDIEKAFDSVRWDYLNNVLWGFRFPEEFIAWISLTQQQACVQILNNGHKSPRITIHHGLAQGCGLSPFLFILAIEGLANHIRSDDRIPGIQVGGVSKKISLIADDTLLSFVGSVTVIKRVKAVLDHFSQVSGLKLNYDKSSLIALGPRKPAWFDEECVAQFKKTHISEGFQYLGLTNGNSLNQLNTNFPCEANLVSRLLETQVHRKSTLSGRILKVRQLVCSTFVYRFQLVPSPSNGFMEQADWQIHNNVWDNGRHRLRKEILSQPVNRGGLNMVNILVQNRALKFAWFNRLLSESVNIQFWSVHLHHCFIIPLCDVLVCNLNHKDLSVLFRQGIISLPPFWTDVFTQWFQHFFYFKRLSPG